MKKAIISIAAAALAGVATYLIRKKLNDLRDNNAEPAAGPNDRHITNVFSKAKSAAAGQAAMP